MTKKKTKGTKGKGTKGKQKTPSAPILTAPAAIGDTGMVFLPLPVIAKAAFFYARALTRILHDPKIKIDRSTPQKKKDGERFAALMATSEFLKRIGMHRDVQMIFIELGLELQDSQIASNTHHPDSSLIWFGRAQAIVAFEYFRAAGDKAETATHCVETECPNIGGICSRGAEFKKSLRGWREKFRKLATAETDPTEMKHALGIYRDAIKFIVDNKDALSPVQWREKGKEQARILSSELPPIR